MPPSSEDDLFRLDPPKPFKYTDWVIRMPKPGIRDFLSPETAKQEYLANRLGLLITAVTARFGNDQCYFSEVSPHGSDGSVINKPVTKNPRHFEVTKLYAIHEVHHWPGAFGQLEWTHFVMANLEHDALCREYGPEANISLPTLPVGALPMYQEMVRDHNSKMKDVLVGPPREPVGEVKAGKVRLYSGNEDLTTLLGDALFGSNGSGSPLLNGSAAAPMSDPAENRSGSTTPTLRTPSRPPTVATTESTATVTAWTPTVTGFTPSTADARSRFIQTVVESDMHFQGVCDQHQSFVEQEVKKLRVCFLRCLSREEDAHRFTWGELKEQATDELEALFLEQAAQWHAERPEIPHDYDDTSGTLVDQQLRYLISRIKHRDPLTAGSGMASAKALQRRYALAAMVRQRQILTAWDKEMTDMATERSGIRYRREGDHVLDAWEGTIMTADEFDDKMKTRGPSGFTAASIPLAATAEEREVQAEDPMEE